MFTIFLSVPNANFAPKGIPPWAQGWNVTEEELEEEYVIPDGLVDLDTHILFYFNTPRQHDLGKKIKQVKLFFKVQTSSKTQSASKTAKRAQASMPPPKKLRLQPGNDPEDDQRSKLDENMVKEEVEAVQKGSGSRPAGSDSRQPGRTLVRSMSDPDKADRGESVLKDLMQTIELASQEGKFYSHNAGNQNSVFFWTREVLNSMDSVSAEEVG